jgi:peptidoglycan/xylan/chitin deacetylase (PgdA/CDA1 family)
MSQLMIHVKKPLAMLIAVASFQLSLAAEGKVVILDYHTFLGNGKSNIDYSEKELAEDLDAMTAMGYKFVSLDDAIAGKIEGVANIVITIDDGNHTVYPAVKHVFEPRGIKPFLFVYPAIVKGHVRYALTPEKLKELVADGCGVGAHGYHHNPVTDKAWDKDPKDFMHEIKLPGPALAAILEAPAPTMFAYPFGVYSKRAQDALALAGYAWAFAADGNVVQVSFDDPSLDHMAVPRTITYRYNRKGLLRELQKLIVYSGPPLFEEPASAPPPVSTELLPSVVAK